MTQLRIISIDGGPAASLQVRILKFLEQQRPGLLASTDVFAGSSDGAFLAMYLASKVTSSNAQNLAVLDESVEFMDDILRAFRPSVLGYARAIVSRPIIPGRRLEKALAAGFGNKKIGDLNKKFLVPSYDFTSGRPAIFSNMPVGPLSYEENFDDWSLVKIGLATSAFPLVLPVFQHVMTDGSGNQVVHRFLDGGFMANNTTMVVVTRALAMLRSLHPTMCVQDLLQMMEVLSLGALQTDGNPAIPKFLQDLWGCIVGDGAKGQFANWGWFQWIGHGAALQMARVLVGAGIVDTAEATSLLLASDGLKRYEPWMDQASTVRRVLLLPPAMLIHDFNRKAHQLIQTAGSTLPPNPANPDDLRPVLTWLAGKSWGT